MTKEEATQLISEEDHNLEWTFHHMNNKPGGCSWGTCGRTVCPILKGE